MTDLDSRFEEFHSANPQVADQLETLASQWLSVHERVGMKMLWEVLRWQIGLRSATGVKPFRLNNSLTSRYARLLIGRRPSWDGRILTRELRS